MVFTNTKREADELALCNSIKQNTCVLHGDIPQDKRERVLKVICFVLFCFIELVLLDIMISVLNVT